MLTKAEREDVREFFIALYKQGGITDARYSQLRALLDDLDAKDEALEPFAGLWRKTIAEMGTVARTTVTFDIGPRTKLCWGDLRRAAEALGGE